MFRIPTITKNLLIINVLAFLAMYVMKNNSFGGVSFDLNEICGLHFFKAADFQVYQLFTYMFMHGGFEHIIFNMFALWMFGCVVERIWGPKRFLFYYIFCGVGAGLFQEVAQYISMYMQLGEQGLTFDQVAPEVFNRMTTVGASGAIYAVLLAFGMTLPNERIFLFPLPIPIKAKWFVMGYAAIELFSALATTPNDHVAHIAHLGGMVFGFFLIRYWNKHPEVEYGKSNGEDAFNKIKNVFGGRNKNSSYSENTTSTWDRETNTSNEHQTDWSYNAQKKANQEEVDRILDKIRKSGYDSLTKEEKQKLFDQSKQ
jgi:membrane associated rhomboid family serine protease